MAGLWTLAVDAAELEFRPTLTFGLYHDGNTAVTGDPTAQGDEVAALALDLSLERTTQDGSLVFSYRPSYVAHHKNTELDYFGQSMDLQYSHAGSRSARYTFDLNAYRSERQGIRPTTPSEPTTFVPRNMETLVGLRVHGTHEGRRNILDWEIRAHLDDYSLESLENSTGEGVQGSWRYELSEKSTLGLGLIFDTIQYETLPSSYIESFGLVGTHEFGRATAMTYVFGVSRSSSSGASDTGFAGGLSISRTISEQSSLSAGVQQTASQGSGLGGMSLDRGGYLSYGLQQPRRGLSASVLAGYWWRSPLDVGAASGSASTTSFNTSESLGWSFNRFLTLSVAHAYVDQSSSDQDALDTRYNSYGFNLRWTIRGR